MLSCRCRYALRNQVHDAAIRVLQYSKRQQFRQDHDERYRHLERSTDHWRHLRGTQIMGAQDSLYYQKVRRSISEANDKPQPEDDSGPMHAHRIVSKAAYGAPHMGVVAST